MNSVPERPNDCPEYTDERLSEIARRTVTNPIESIAMCAEMMKMRDCYTNEVARLVAEANIRARLFEDDDAAITRLLRENQRLHEDLEGVRTQRDTLERENIRMFREINSGPKLPDEVREHIEYLIDAAPTFGDDPDHATVAMLLSDWLKTLPEPPRPNWDDAPSWARYRTVDADGTVRWWSGWPDDAKIGVGGSRWWGDGITGESEKISIPLGIDWRTLIERRPDSDPT